MRGMRGYPRIGVNEDESMALTHTSGFGVSIMFCVVGVRPGSRATFVSAKVAKTTSAWPRPRWGTFIPDQIMLANNSLRSNRFARQSDLARDSAVSKAGILFSVVEGLEQARQDEECPIMGTGGRRRSSQLTVILSHRRKICV